MEMLICSEVDFRSGLWYCKAMEGIPYYGSRRSSGSNRTDY